MLNFTIYKVQNNKKIKTSYNTKGGILMWDFIINAIIWTLALYGVFEIIKTIIYICSYTRLKSDGIYVIVAVKNQEKQIEGFMRGIMFRLLYGKEEYIKEIIVSDLDSKDNTLQILNKLQKDYDCIKVSNWKECEELINNIKVN